jgi:hypothetical protein
VRNLGRENNHGSHNGGANEEAGTDGVRRKRGRAVQPVKAASNPQGVGPHDLTEGEVGKRCSDRRSNGKQTEVPVDEGDHLSGGFLGGGNGDLRELETRTVFVDMVDSLPEADVDGEEAQVEESLVKAGTLIASVKVSASTESLGLLSIIPSLDHNAQLVFVGARKQVESSESPRCEHVRNDCRIRNERADASLKGM